MIFLYKFFETKPSILFWTIEIAVVVQLINASVVKSVILSLDDLRQWIATNQCKPLTKFFGKPMSSGVSQVNIGGQHPLFLLLGQIEMLLAVDSGEDQILEPGDKRFANSLVIKKIANQDYIKLRLRGLRCTRNEIFPTYANAHVV